MSALIRKVKALTFHDPLAVLDHLHDKSYTLFFDSNDNAHPAARFSFIAFDPIEIFTLNNEAPFETLSDAFGAYTINEDLSDPCPPVPFTGGLAGLFGYDLSRSLENLPDTARKEIEIPDIAVGLYTNVVAYDLQAQKAWLITHVTEDDDNVPALDITPPIQTEYTASFTPKWHSNFTQSTYETAVQNVIDYIRDGDVFQVNIAQRFTANLPPDFASYTHYKALRQINPAPFSAYMYLEDGQAIASSSPERFLELRSGHVTTKPIKGTTPRSSDLKEDKTLSDTLRNSIKNRAENTMIVDLLRNDLSKVCTPESVEVNVLCEVESFAGLHHLVSTINATLKPDHTAIDLLRACFPGGSITGAPKIRAMEIIEKLENIRRGPYCGTLAWIDFNGDMDSNILIRTLIYQQNTVCFSVGGGITLNSDPAQEYQETLDKAEKIFRSFD